MKHHDTKLLLLSLLQGATILEAAIWDITILPSLLLLPVLLVAALYAKSTRKKLANSLLPENCKVL